MFYSTKHNIYTNPNIRHKHDTHTHAHSTNSNNCARTHTLKELRRACQSSFNSVVAYWHLYHANADVPLNCGRNCPVILITFSLYGHKRFYCTSDSFTLYSSPIYNLKLCFEIKIIPASAHIFQFQLLHDAKKTTEKQRKPAKSICLLLLQ